MMEALELELQLKVVSDQRKKIEIPPDPMSMGVDDIRMTKEDKEFI